MFVRKRARQTRSGITLYFTVVESHRTEKGPRQRAVVSWTSPADPGHPRFTPSLAKAVDAAEGSVRFHEHYARKHREELRGTNEIWIRQKTYFGSKFVHRSDVEEWAQKAERDVAQERAKVDALKDALAQIGDWTWDGNI